MRNNEVNFGGNNCNQQYSVFWHASSSEDVIYSVIECIGGLIIVMHGIIALMTCQSGDNRPTKLYF